MTSHLHESGCNSLLSDVRRNEIAPGRAICRLMKSNGRVVVFAAAFAVCVTSIFQYFASTSFASAESSAQTKRPPTSVNSIAGTTTLAPEGTEIFPEQSRVYIFVGKTGLGHDHGIEGRFRSGWLRPGAGENAGEFVFDMQTFDADTDAARRYTGLPGSTDASTRRQVNENMKGPGVLDVRRYPTATYKITSAIETARKSKEGHPMYQLDGQFTLHGVTHPLKFPVEVIEEEQTLRVKGSFTIMQTAYGITPFRKALGAVGVTNQLKIYGDVRIPRPQGL